MHTDDVISKALAEVAVEHNWTEKEVENLLDKMFVATRKEMSSGQFSDILWAGFGTFRPKLSFVKSKLKNALRGTRANPEDRTNKRMDYIGKLNRTRNRLIFDKAARSHKTRKEYREWLKIQTDADKK